MRQTGILSASAAYALTNNFVKLPHVHSLARRLEQGLKDIGAHITSPAETCMVRHSPLDSYARTLPEPRFSTTHRLLVWITPRSPGAVAS